MGSRSNEAVLASKDAKGAQSRATGLKTARKSRDAAAAGGGAFQVGFQLAEEEAK
jgi:hypothetical protein